MGRPDIETVIRAIDETLEGKSDSYSVIVTAYMEKLYSLARSICRNDTTAQDLVQETLVDGYLRLYTLREKEKIEPWLMRILKNKAFNHIARTYRTESPEMLDGVVDRISPEMFYMTRESMHEWKKRLSTLTPALRETAMLYFWYGFSMEEIADHANLPLGTVKRRIHDARQKLKKEKAMANENCTLPDAFAEEVSAKIKELENYTNIYGTSKGFSSAYDNVKELIKNLSKKEDVREYSVKVADIAARTDIDKYAPETLELYRRYNMVQKASNLFIEIWNNFDNSDAYNYIRDTVLPELEAYPESEEKNIEIGRQFFWISWLVDRNKPDGIAQTRACLDKAMEAYSKTKAVDPTYAAVISAYKALDIHENKLAEKQMRSVNAQVTGETWKIEDNNLYYFAQPGCNYYYNGLLGRFNYPIFYNAGDLGDGRFLPCMIPLKPGVSEPMIDKCGEECGIRKVISLDETVETPAGVFENCLHIEKITEGESTHIWYKEGVGLVKLYDCTDGLHSSVLKSYEIKGGQGWMPLAVGNKWVYESLVKPDCVYEHNEYVIERIGDSYDAGKSVCVSALNYSVLEENDDDMLDEPVFCLFNVAELCDEGKYDEAKQLLRRIIIRNHDRETVDIALSILEYFEEKAIYDAQNWRFCPSSAAINSIIFINGNINYLERFDVDVFNAGPWGSRHEENRIFGVKPFRYLNDLCMTLWDERWVPGYSTEYAEKCSGLRVKLSVDHGGRIETPAGVFEETVCLKLICDTPDNPERYDSYFYSHTECGTKEFWFARGVGVVRFRCTWGHHLDSDALLTEYNTVADEDEMMPIHIGNRWRYEEQKLTAENYIARKEYKILGGTKGDYYIADHQMFTWRGSVDEYEAWKKTL